MEKLKLNAIDTVKWKILAEIHNRIKLGNGKNTKFCDGKNIEFCNGKNTKIDAEKNIGIHAAVKVVIIMSIYATVLFFFIFSTADHSEIGCTA